MSRSISARLRFEILKRDNFRCQYCGAAAPMVQLEIEHVVPYVAGGSSHPDNLLAACQRCNAGKSAISLDAKLPSLQARQEKAAAANKAAWVESSTQQMLYLREYMAFKLGLHDLAATDASIVWNCFLKFGSRTVEDAFDCWVGMPGVDGRYIFDHLEALCVGHLEFLADEAAQKEVA